MRALLTAALLLIIGLGIWSTACADLPYGAQVVAVQSTSAPYTWTYTVRNTSILPQFTLWGFAIEVDKQTDPLNIVTPGGWIVNTDQEHLVTWMYMSGELQPGSKKAGFQATFGGSPAFQRFTAMFDNAETGESPSTIGMVETSLPEPAGAAVLLTGFAPFVGYALRRRSRG